MKPPRRAELAGLERGGHDLGVWWPWAVRSAGGCVSGAGPTSRTLAVRARTGSAVTRHGPWRRVLDAVRRPGEAWVGDDDWRAHLESATGECHGPATAGRWRPRCAPRGQGGPRWPPPGSPCTRTWGSRPGGTVLGAPPARPPPPPAAACPRTLPRPWRPAPP